MSFEAPIWLYLTPLLLLLFGAMVLYGFQRRDALLGRFAASRLLDQLTEQASRPRTWIKAGCVLFAVAAIAIALARPQYGVEWSERKARGLDIVFVLDSSKSMLATDLRPTRLDRAKLAILDLVERLESDRIGLVAFAGQAFLQTPPTLDYSAFRESLEAVDPEIMTSGGSDLGTALKEASEAFPSENNVKVVVLLTDGEDLGGQAIEAARAASSAGIQVFAIGIGTTEGEYLKVRNQEGIEEFVRNADGQPVLSQLDETTLQQIAQLTGGSYSRLSGDSLDQLYNNVIATLPREERESELQEIRVERFQWALSAAAFFLVLETLIRRRRSASIQASALLIAALALHPSDAQAQTEPQTPTEMQAENEANASTDARRLYNNAYETLSAGEYEAAAKLYERALSNTQDLKLQADSLYNMGHAAYQQGRSLYESGDPQTALEQMKQAEQRFQSAQEIAPDDHSIEEDLKQIRQVRKVIEEFLEQQKQQQDQQEPQDQENSSDPQQQDQEQEQESDQSQDSQDSQEQDSQQSEDKQDSQQNQNSSQQGEQQGQQGQQSQDSSDPSGQDPQGEQDNQDPQDPQQDPSQQPAQADQNEQEPEPSDSSQSTPPESTEDPFDDIPQPQAGEESEEPGEQNQEQTNMPEPGEGEATEGQSAAGSLSGEAVEGMTEAEAAALLDTLRGKETLLPFIDPQRSGRNRDIRDW